MLRRHLFMARSASSIPWHVDSDARQRSVAAFNAFLFSVSSSVKHPRPPASVHVFMGNEAADADSIVSSLTCAFLHAQQQQQQKHFETLCVPVLPITRDELVLRCDVTALFQALDVATDALVFVDEFPWDLHTRVKVTLLDHNALNNKKMPWANGMNVVAIVDHHSDLGQHLDAEKREVAFAHGHALVASTCTLVAERLEKVTAHHDAHKLLSTMLLGVIALDSINFDPSAKKVTPRDIKAAQKLEEVAFAKKEDLFKWLQAEKFNPVHWKAFTLENCLQVDYKEFTFGKKVGISTVLVDLKTFVLKSKDAAALRKRLSAYCKQNDLAFLMVMAMFMMPDGQRHRQFLVFQENGSDAKHCVTAFEKEGSLRLEALQLPETHQNEHVVAFSQRNTGASRKQVALMLQRAFAEPVVKL